MLVDMIIILISFVLGFLVCSLIISNGEKIRQEETDINNEWEDFDDLA